MHSARFFARRQGSCRAPAPHPKSPSPLCCREGKNEDRVMPGSHELPKRSYALFSFGKACFHKFAECLGAVADLVFALGVHLAEGLAAAIGQEHGVIAEAAIAARRPDEAAMHLPFE